MRTCTECGANLGDQDNFCPLCGAKAPEAAPTPAPTLRDTLDDLTGQGAGPNQEPIQEPVSQPAAPAEPVSETPEGEAGTPAQAPKKLSPKHLGMIAAGLVAVLVVALVGWLVSGLLQGPDRRFVSYHQKMFASLANKELSSAKSNVDRLSGFSTDLTFTARVKGEDLDEDYRQLSEFLNDTALVMKVDLDKTALKLGGDLIVQGNSVFSGTALYDKGTVGFQVPQASDTYYTADLAGLVENFTGERVEGLNSIELPQIPEKELNKVAKTYMTILTSAVTKESVTTKEDTFRLEQLPGRRVEGTAYIYQPIAADVEEMLYDLADQEENDQDLRDLVNKFLGGNVTWINAILAENGSDDLDTILDEGLEGWARDLRDNAPDIAQEIEDGNFTWTLWVGKGGVYKGEITSDWGSAVCYERTENGLAFWTEYNGEVEEEVLTLEYEKGDDGLYRGTYTLGGGSSIVTLEFYNVDPGKQSALGYYYGDYILRQETTYVYYDYTSTVEVAFHVAKGQAGGTDHILDMAGILPSYDTDVPQMEIVLNSSDKKSTVTTPKGPREDFTDYSQEELDRLFADLGEALTEYFEELEDVLDLPTYYY